MWFKAYVARTELQSLKFVKILIYLLEKKSLVVFELLLFGFEMHPVSDCEDSSNASSLNLNQTRKSHLVCEQAGVPKLNTHVKLAVDVPSL